MLNRPYGGFPWILLPPVLYDTFPNAHNGYGDFTELEQASLDDAAAFFDTYYAPGNAQVTVAGYLGADVDGVLALVEKHFGDIPARPTPVRPSFAEPLPGTERRAVSPDAHAPLPALAVGYRLPDPGAELDAYLGHALLASVLGDGEAARLQRRLVHVDGLVTDVSASAGPDGAARRARPRHVHDHRRAPAVGRPGPGARRRSTRSSTSWRPPGRTPTSWPARSRAGPRRCTTRTTA